MHTFSRISIQAEAQARDRIHRNQASSRPLSGDYSLLGVAGEVQFEKDFGIARKKELLPGGDGRIDFTLGRYTFDPKAAKAAPYIFREVDKEYAQIIVQGKFCEDGETIWVSWRGWEYAELLLDCPVKRFHEKGPMNHYLPIDECRKMKELETLIEREKMRLGLVVPAQPLPELTHDQYCSGCYEVEPGIFIHPPKNGGPR